jgi:hypothetical protein
MDQISLSLSCAHALVRYGISAVGTAAPRHHEDTLYPHVCGGGASGCTAGSQPLPLQRLHRPPVSGAPCTHGVPSRCAGPCAAIGRCAYRCRLRLSAYWSCIGCVMFGALFALGFAWWLLSLSVLRSLGGVHTMITSAACIRNPKSGVHTGQNVYRCSTARAAAESARSIL